MMIKSQLKSKVIPETSIFALQIVSTLTLRKDHHFLDKILFDRLHFYINDGSINTIIFIYMSGGILKFLDHQT